MSKTIEIGVLLDSSDSVDHTPIWLSISDQKWNKSENTIHALNDFDSINSFENNYGIVLHTGMDKNQVVNHIVGKAREVLEYLNNRLSGE